jgi:hypothetical protein
VRRRKAPETGALRVLPQPSDLGHEVVFREIDAFNRAMAECPMRYPDKLTESLDWLLSAGQRDALDAGSRYVMQRYAESDALARVNQERRKQVIVAASALTVVAALSQATYGVVADQPWIIAYGVAIALAYGLYFLLFRQPSIRIEDRYLEYRALAEAARVQLFWRLSGLPTMVAEHYLQLVKSDVGWVREAVRNIGTQADLLCATSPPNLAIVRERWLLDQEKYFLGKEPPKVLGNVLKRKIWRARADRATNAAFAIGGLLILLAWGSHVLPELYAVKEAAGAFSASFFLIAGVIKGFAATMGYAEEAASFEKAGGVFRNAREYVDAHDGEPDKFRTCVLELGKYALAENADWLLQHRRNAFKIQNG